MRISDWSSDVCSSDLSSWDRGWLSCRHGPVASPTPTTWTSIGNSSRHEMPAPSNRARTSSKCVRLSLASYTATNAPPENRSLHMANKLFQGTQAAPGKVYGSPGHGYSGMISRSDERRGGKEGVGTFRFRGAPNDKKKN